MALKYVEIVKCAFIRGFLKLFETDNVYMNAQQISNNIQKR